MDHINLTNEMRRKRSEWEEDCLKWRHKVLRGPDRHWCNDWDGLPVSAFTLEYDCCTEHKTLLGRICNWFYMKWWNFWDTQRLRGPYDS